MYIKKFFHAWLSTTALKSIDMKVLNNPPDVVLVWRLTVKLCFPKTPIWLNQSRLKGSRRSNLRSGRSLQQKHQSDSRSIFGPLFRYSAQIIPREQNTYSGVAHGSNTNDPQRKLPNGILPRDDRKSIFRPKQMERSNHLFATRKSNGNSLPGGIDTILLMTEYQG